MAVPQMQKMGALGTEVAAASQAAITDVTKGEAARVTAEAAKERADKEMSSGMKAIISGGQTLSSMIQAGSALWEAGYKADLAEAQTKSLHEGMVSDRQDRRIARNDEAAALSKQYREQHPHATEQQLFQMEQAHYQRLWANESAKEDPNEELVEDYDLRRQPASEEMKALWGKGIRAIKHQTLQNKAKVEQLISAQVLKVTEELGISSQAWKTIQVLKTALPSFLETPYGEHLMSLAAKDVTENFINQGLSQGMAVLATKKVIGGVGLGAATLEDQWEQGKTARSLERAGVSKSEVEEIKMTAASAGHFFKDPKVNPYEVLANAHMRKNTPEGESIIRLFEILSQLGDNQTRLPEDYDRNLSKYFKRTVPGTTPVVEPNNLVLTRGGHGDMRKVTHMYLGMLPDLAIEGILALSGEKGAGLINEFDVETRDLAPERGGAIGVPMVGRGIVGIATGQLDRQGRATNPETGELYEFEKATTSDDASHAELQLLERTTQGIFAIYDAILTAEADDVSRGSRMRDSIIDVLRVRTKLDDTKLKTFLTAMRDLYRQADSPLFNRKWVQPDKMTAVRAKDGPKITAESKAYAGRLRTSAARVYDDLLNRLEGKEGIPINAGHIRPMLEQGLFEDGLYYNKSQGWNFFGPFSEGMTKDMTTGRFGVGGIAGLQEFPEVTTTVQTQLPLMNYFIGDTGVPMNMKTWFADQATGGHMWNSNYGYQVEINRILRDTGKGDEPASTVRPETSPGSIRRVTGKYNIKDPKQDAKQDEDGNITYDATPTVTQAGFDKKAGDAALGSLGRIKTGRLTDHRGHLSDIEHRAQMEEREQAIKHQMAGGKTYEQARTAHFAQEKLNIYLADDGPDWRTAFDTDDSAAFPVLQGKVNEGLSMLKKWQVSGDTPKNDPMAEDFLVLAKTLHGDIQSLIDFKNRTNSSTSTAVASVLPFGGDPVALIDAFKKILADKGMSLPGEPFYETLGSPGAPPGFGGSGSKFEFIDRE